MDNINIQAIIGKHSPLLAAALEHNKSTEINPENVKAAIKEIIEAVINKCAEEAGIKVQGQNNYNQEDYEYTTQSHSCREDEYIQIDKESILAIKTQINYE